MTERERHTNPGGTQDNVRDEGADRGKPAEAASTQAVEEEEQTGGPGSVKDAEDEQDEPQEP